MRLEILLVFDFYKLDIFVIRSLLVSNQASYLQLQLWRPTTKLTLVLRDIVW